MQIHSMHDDRQPETTGRHLALSLGLFSIALGVAELTAPRTIARLIGIREDDRTLSILRAFGAREISSGLAVLAKPGSPGPLWSRVAGDAIDLAAIGATFRPDGTNPQRAAAAAASVIGVTMLDVLCARQLAASGDSSAARQVSVRETITINKPIEQVYGFWRSLENLPRFMQHLERVDVVDSRRSHWRARGPAGIPVEWDAEIVDERDQELLAWQSVPGSRLSHHGMVRFRHAPGARGTEVRIHLEYTPPAGALGRSIGWLFGRNPEQQVQEDLRRFKQLLETGEITQSDGPGLWRPARPRRQKGRSSRPFSGVQS